MKQFYKTFSNISKGVENHGYIEWKKEVKTKLLQMHEVQLTNYKKRVEISYETEKHFKQKRNLVDFFAHITAFFLPFLGVMVALCSSWGMGLNSIILSSGDDNIELKELALETTNSLQGTLLYFCVIVLAISLILSFICFQIERWLSERNINLQIYFSELLKIINEIEESEEWKSKKERKQKGKSVSNTNA